MAPLEELKQLAAGIDSASSLDALKPIYERLALVARQNQDDFEVQLVAENLREQLVRKGVHLRESSMLPAAAGPANGVAVKPPPVAAPVNIRRVLAIGAGIGVAGWLIFFVTVVQIARNRNSTPATQPPPTAASSPASRGTVPVDIVTTPPGATIQINNENRCTSNCRVNLAPGNYQVTAMLDGFDPSATGVTVVAGAGGAPINVSLTLLNQAQTVRVFTDLPSGRVLLDGKPVGELQDGQLVLDRVPNGAHKLNVIGPINEASFALKLEAGKAPVVDGPINVNNLVAVLVGSMGSSAHVQSSGNTPLRVSLNGMAQGETTAKGLDLSNVPAGEQQLAIGEGAEMHKMVVPFGAMPSLTAFLKSDVNSGTLVVVTAQDDVSVFLDGKEYKRKTKRGQLRVQALGKVNVRVAKEGFQPVTERTVDVKKGEEARLSFELHPLPQVAALQVRGATAGTILMIDDRPAGRVGADGLLSVANLTPGERMIELRRDGFLSKKSPRVLKAGETLVISGAETVLTAAAATLHLVLNPSDAQVTFRRADEAQTHVAIGNALKLEPGNYVFTAKAANHTDVTQRVLVAGGETRNLEITLPREAPPSVAAVTPSKPTPTGTTDWSGWSNQGGGHVRKGGNRVAVRTGYLNGTITFTAQLRKAGGIFRGGRLRWFLDDDGRISQFEIDKKHFYTPDGGRVIHDELDENKTYTIQVDVTPDRITQRLKVDEGWITLGSQPGRTITNGRFGFVIPGSDEVAISNFHFTPKP